MGNKGKTHQKSKENRKAKKSKEIEKSKDWKVRVERKKAWKSQEMVSAQGTPR